MIQKGNGDPIGELLSRTTTIAVVGMSDKPERASYRVAAYLQKQGYRIIPVNPALTEVLGMKAYAALTDIPEKIDIVNIFRKSEAVGPIAAEAIAVGSGAIWMQEGVINEAAAAQARSAGLQVVMDRCLMKEHRARSN